MSHIKIYIFLPMENKYFIRADSMRKIQKLKYAHEMLKKKSNPLCSPRLCVFRQL
jgi:hypothetical protein